MKIVMTDQDGVLFGRNYKTTIDVGDFLQKLPKDIFLIPNSDTPVERIANNFLSVTGVQPSAIIGENGAVVFFEGKFYNISNISGINGFIEKLGVAFANQSCDIIIGDSATWIKEQKKFVPNRRMLIIDRVRKQSVAFYLRTTDQNGVACLDNDWFKTGLEIAKSVIPPIGLKTIMDQVNSLGSNYGIVILNAKGITKTDGYKFLRRRYPSATFYMIGDGDADIINDPEVIHCAVANASIDLKNISKFVSGSRITAGFIDCLRWIMER